jgi:hypothetical protein
MKTVIALLLTSAIWGANYTSPHAIRPKPFSIQITTPYYKENQIPCRFQWDANFGYCGESSFIAAGLFYGQYCSQYTARSIASPGKPQQQEGSQLLLGVNDASTAAAMHLAVEIFDTENQSSTEEFFVWMKEKVIQGYPVTAGFFNNEYLFYDRTDPNAGDPTYDHIADVYAIGSKHPLDDLSYYPDDRFYMNDHGLYTPGGSPIYRFNYGFEESKRNRRQANAKSAPPYSINSNYDIEADGGNFGIAFLGVLDENSDTIPVRVATNVNYERPSIAEGSNTQPNPMPLQLTVTVTIPDQSESYNLHYYTSFDQVPNSNFNSSPSIKTWVIPPNSGSTYTLKIPSQESGIDFFFSNQIAVFRAVRTSAP